MSAYIENNHHNNISQFLSTCEAPKGFSVRQINAKADFWASRSRQRRQLSRLEAHQLADVGITEEQVKIELAKPFWK